MTLGSVDSWLSLLLVGAALLRRTDWGFDACQWLLREMGQLRYRYRTSALRLLFLGPLTPMLAGVLMGLFMIAAAPLGWVVVTSLSGLQGIHSVPSILLMAVALTYLLSGPFIRLWLVPRGRVRATYVTANWTGDSVTNQVRSTAVILAVRAWRVSDRQADHLEWLRQRLVRDRVVSPGTLTACGLLAAARGDVDTARAWMRSVAWLTSWRGTRAQEWLCAEAATRGAWREVVRQGGTVTSTATTRYLHAVARRCLGQPVSSRSLAWLRFWAPKRIGQVPWEEVCAETVADPDALARALRLQVELGAAPGAAHLLEVGQAWDRAEADVDEELRADWKTMVVEGLESCVRRCQAPLSELEAGSECLALACRNVRLAWLKDLESRYQAIHVRTEALQALPLLEEWQEWCLARVAFDDAVSRLSLTDVQRIWRLWHARWCDYGVWLTNVRKQRWLAHLLFIWLLGHAQTLGDAEAIALQTKNSKATR